MKKKYYSIVLDNTNGKLDVEYIGEYSDEDDALDGANLFGRKNKKSIIWTCTYDELKSLSDSINSKL